MPAERTTPRSAKEQIRKLLVDLYAEGIHVTHIDVIWRTDVSLDSAKPEGSVSPVVTFEAKL